MEWHSIAKNLEIAYSIAKNLSIFHILAVNGMLHTFCFSSLCVMQIKLQNTCYVVNSSLVYKFFHSLETYVWLQLQYVFKSNCTVFILLAYNMLLFDAIRIAKHIKISFCLSSFNGIPFKLPLTNEMRLFEMWHVTTSACVSINKS